MRRIATVLAVAAVLAAGLTACSTTVNEPRNAAVCGPYSSGPSSDADSARWTSTGPKVTFPTPLKATKPQVTQLRAGTGTGLGDGDVAQLGFTLSLGSDGTEIQSGGFGKDSFFPWVVGKKGAIGKALECRSVGARVALVGSVADVLGTGVGQNLGVSDATNVVIVFQVLHRFPGKADGVNVLQDNSLPAVVTATDGQPGIVLPNVNKQPTTFRSAVVKAGGGAVVAKGDKVLVQHQSWTWGDTATVDSGTSTWTADSPNVVTAGEALTQSNGPSIAFPTRLTGEKVGSQLIFVYPASQGGSTTVWVVDILGIVK